MDANQFQPHGLEEIYRTLKERNLPYDQLLCLAAILQMYLEENERLVRMYSELSEDRQETLVKGFSFLIRLGELREELGVTEGKTKGRRETAMKAAMAKLERDPKQAAKAQAKELWREWQMGKTRHKSGAAFARYVLKCLPNIESTESVNRWVREWRAEAEKQLPS